MDYRRTSSRQAGPVSAPLASQQAKILRMNSVAVRTALKSRQAGHAACLQLASQPAKILCRSIVARAILRSRQAGHAASKPATREPCVLSPGQLRLRSLHLPTHHGAMPRPGGSAQDAAAHLSQDQRTSRSTPAGFPTPPHGAEVAFHADMHSVVCEPTPPICFSEVGRSHELLTATLVDHSPRRTI